MSIIWAFVLPLVTLLIFLIVFAVLAYVGAPYNMWFTYVRDGTIKTVVAGKKYKRFIVNVKGHYFNEATRKIEKTTSGEDKAPWFTEQTGLYFVSWIWPIRHIYTFDILKVRLKTDRDKIKKIEEKIDIDEETTRVDELLWKIDRPFLMMDVDLSDGTRVNILGRGIYTVWDPYQLLFGLSGKFFDNLDSLVEAYIISKYKIIDLDALRTKATELKPSELTTGQYDLMTTVGLIAENLVIEEFSISDEDPEIQKAVQLQKLETERAKQTNIKARAEQKRLVTEAKGQAIAKRLVGLAESARDLAIIEAYKEAKMDPSDIADIFKKEHIKELKGTYFEAGGKRKRPVPAVSINHSLPEPAQPKGLLSEPTEPASEPPTGKEGEKGGKK